MESLMTIISQVGFPIAVAVYLLIRQEKRLEDMKQSFNDLKDSILGKDGVLDKIEDIKKGGNK